MRLEHWEKSLVTGYDGEKKQTAAEKVYHRRGEDPLTMAMRRNPDLPGCGRIRIQTEEAFTEFIKEWEPAAAVIPKDRDRTEWEYDM